MNCLSFLAGIVVFSSLGYLSIQVNKNIEDVVDSGLGLSFIAYPELLSTLKFPSFFSFMFSVATSPSGMSLMTSEMVCLMKILSLKRI